MQMIWKLLIGRDPELVPSIADVHKLSSQNLLMLTSFLFHGLPSGRFPGRTSQYSVTDISSYLGSCVSQWSYGACSVPEKYRSTASRLFGPISLWICSFSFNQTVTEHNHVLLTVSVGPSLPVLTFRFRDYEFPSNVLRSASNVGLFYFWSVSL